MSESIEPSTSTTTTTTTTSSTTTPTPPAAKNTGFSRNEATVGITCFLGTTAPYKGLLKQRYSDFIVNEVDLDDNVVSLTSLTYEDPTTPKQDATATVETETTTTTESESESSKPINTEEEIIKFNKLKELVGEEQMEEFKAFFNGPSKTEITSTYKFKENKSKEERTNLHKLIKDFDLVTETKDNRVVVSAGCNTRKRELARNVWGGDKPKFVQFVLHKENKELLDAIGILSNVMHVNQRSFSFAGTKDKRGVTSQRVTVYRQSPENIVAANQRLFSSIRVGGDFKYVDKHLMLGDLNGNRFTVVIRDVSGDDELIAESVAQLNHTGFINYYGLQRFGTGSVSTNQVGLEVIKGNWENAVMLILGPREGENEDFIKARTKYKENGDADALLQALPKYMVSERKLLMVLKRDKKGFYNAINSLPRTLRMLYPHSYQSYIWNKMASERITKFGFKEVVVGDLVAVSKNNNNKQQQQEKQKDEKNEEEGSGDVVEMPVEDDGGDDKDDYQVTHVTEDDIKNKRYTIDQVVLPMPGSNIVYPSNEIGQRYKEVMLEDGVDEAKINHNKTKVFHLKGSYRKIISRPINLEYKIYRYDSAKIPLALSDLDRLNGKEEPQDLPDGKYKALRLSFSLPSSSYATMVYRELLKQPTNVLQQQQQFNHEKDNNNNNEEDNNTKNLKRKLSEFANNDGDTTKKEQNNEKEETTITEERDTKRSSSIPL
ncbi:tRNA pseudouridine synthase D [Cavenderia fasciculata]|uniref:tRNA pseudouridine synthase D n=1 Tax=Cavenderia fasciculata TaxID=261658 RepID=F4PJQ5_CACFS|nr:tRNA pseudouridine synthase D [Cavenderia fasciculata]EGG23829.1 tRNA pseudouridine synthase D [Cavenderia fasciculata]|eukprot:XP_004361680.1 tRNA pseudouridine synthase D [Cavenderia fasciculata]